MIIDSVNYTNGVSEEMVTKLGLKTKPLQNPNNIKWLQECGGLRISKQCLVSFQLARTIRMRYGVMLCQWILALVAWETMGV